MGGFVGNKYIRTNFKYKNNLDEQKTGFQNRTDNILRRMDSKEDIFDQPLAKPIQSNLTEEEKKQLNELFVKQDKTNEDVLQLNFLIKKSKK